jgi:phosphatidylinositol 4-kinase
MRYYEESNRPSAQKYLASNESVALENTGELGASVALQFACAIGPSERKLGECLTTTRNFAPLTNVY